MLGQRLMVSMKNKRKNYKKFANKLDLNGHQNLNIQSIILTQTGIVNGTITISRRITQRGTTIIA